MVNVLKRINDQIDNNKKKEKIGMELIKKCDWISYCIIKIKILSLIFDNIEKELLWIIINSHIFDNQ